MRPAEQEKVEHAELGIIEVSSVEYEIAAVPVGIVISKDTSNGEGNNLVISPIYLTSLLVVKHHLQSKE